MTFRERAARVALRLAADPNNLVPPTPPTPPTGRLFDPPKAEKRLATATERRLL